MNGFVLKLLWLEQKKLEHRKTKVAAKALQRQRHEAEREIEEGMNCAMIRLPNRPTGSVRETRSNPRYWFLRRALVNCLDVRPQGGGFHVILDVMCVSISEVTDDPQEVSA